MSILESKITKEYDKRKINIFYKNFQIFGLDFIHFKSI